MASNRTTSVEITAKNKTQAGLKEAQKSVQEFGETVKTTLEGAFAILGAATLGEFFKASVEESMKATRNFTDLSVALRNVGANAQTAMPGIQKLVEQLGDKTGMNIEDINGAMVRLITSTGDYHKAMTALPVTLDVAKARHLDLEQAATLVSKAYNGNETALKRLGVVVRDGQTPFDALRGAYKGFADEEGKTFEGQLGRIKNSWNEVLIAVGDAITGNDAMSDASEGLAGALKDVEAYIRQNHQAIGDMTAVVIQLGKWLGWFVGGTLQLAVEGFKVLESSVIAATAGFKEIPEAGKLAFGGFLDMLGSFVTSASGVLDKFGIHFADGVGDRLKQSGQAMVKGASEAIDQINADMIDAMGDIQNPTAAKKKPVSNLPKVPADASAGNESKQHKDEEDKRFHEQVAGLTALLSLDDQHAKAKQQLVDIATHELAILHNSTASAQERIKAAERYGMVQKAIEADETKRYTDAFNNDRAMLDFADKRTAGLQGLNALATQELAIANSTTASIHDRQQAMARYKAIVDAIKGDDDRRFADQLKADQGLLHLADQRTATMAKLRHEAEVLKKTAEDTSKPDQDRIKAADRLNQILSATGGKLHLAMTGVESFEAVTQGLRDMADETGNLNNVLGELAGTTLTGLTDGLAGAFQAMGAGKGIFESLGNAAKKSVADAAKHEGQLEIGRGMAALATGTWPPNPVALAAAGKHFAAGAFLEALGGAVGGGGGSSGGSAAGSAHSMQQTQTAMANTQPQGQIVVQGGLLNLNDPKQADQFANAIQTVTGRRMVITGDTTSVRAMY